MTSMSECRTNKRPDNKWNQSLNRKKQAVGVKTGISAISSTQWIMSPRKRILLARQWTRCSMTRGFSDLRSQPHRPSAEATYENLSERLQISAIREEQTTPINHLKAGRERRNPHLPVRNNKEALNCCKRRSRMRWAFITGCSHRCRKLFSNRWACSSRREERELRRVVHCWWKIAVTF